MLPSFLLLCCFSYANHVVHTVNFTLMGIPQRSQTNGPVHVESVFRSQYTRIEDPLLVTSESAFLFVRKGSTSLHVIQIVYNLLTFFFQSAGCIVLRQQ